APAADGLGDEPIVYLPATVDAGVVKYLEALKAHAARHPALVLDASAVKSIDLVGAELLLRVVNAFKRAAHELTLVGPERLCEALQRAVQPSRRDPSDAGWMLLLEMLRLLERQTDFEETGIQYCITYEVSPPSWEPISPNMRTEPARPLATPTTPPAAASQAGGPGLRWYGQIEGEGEPHFGRVALAAQNFEGTLAVDCRQLQRMSFSAGSALLNLTLRLQQAGVTLQLLDVNALVGALLHLLGVTAVCAVQLRRD
ncbi:MAG TPA: STAS domain-containing protein, partial [Burkholderiaceae bacterium]|nr:STAS domain-containing protein [Burkholderiaceae bacterium]